MKQLILGGIRSGKSRLAEQYATDSKKPVVFVATATAGDAEMRARIERHKQSRPASWQLIEEPIALAATLKQFATEDRCVVVECLTMWMTNLLCDDDPALLQAEKQYLLDILPSLSGHIIFVSNETNMGIIPSGDLARRYCDEMGQLHQEIARQSDRVILAVAGLEHILKGGVH